MLQITNGSETAIIVIHEIYGINAHMRATCRKLAEQGYDVFCPNIINRKTPFEYVEEETAYHHFKSLIGFSAAARQIKTVLLDCKNTYENVFLVGFSVGATIAWLCSEEEDVSGIVCYYGSRIRDYLEVKPRCPALLFFPEKESSFPVTELLSNLKDKNVYIHQFKGRHGFADPYSLHFHIESAQNAWNIMIPFIEGK